MKKIISMLLVVSFMFAAFPCFINKADAAVNAVTALTSPEITPVWESENTYVGYCEYTVPSTSSFKIKWRDVADTYNVAVKLLNGEPNPGNPNETGTYLYDYTTGFTSTYIKLSSTDMKKAKNKWIKVFVQSCYKNHDTKYGGHFYFFVSDADVDEEISLSKSLLSFGWDSTSSKSVSVNCSGSFTYSIEYDVPSSVKSSSYNYQWIKCTQSGDTLTIAPNRKNFADTSRTAYLTVTTGSYSESLTITQSACGEGKPTLNIKRGSTVLKNGQGIGTFKVQNEFLEFSLEKSNIRKITAHLAPVPGNTIQTSTSTNKISFDLTGLKAGNYRITVYASSSDTANDYWSQRPFDSFVLNFSLVGDGSSGGGGATSDDNNVISTNNILADTALSLVGKDKSKLSISDNVNWCALFVSYCANKCGLTDKIFLSNGSHANPLCILVKDKAQVYYYYKNDEYSEWETWRSENCNPGNKIDYFMNDFSPTYLENKVHYSPVPGDLIFIKSSEKKGNSPWAHVGIIVDYDKATNMITFVDGNNNGNGTWLAGKKTTNGSVDCDYVNKLTTNLNDDDSIMAIAHPYYEVNNTNRTYTITYDGNDWEDGKPTVTKATKKHGETLIIAGANCENGDRDFLGWATEDDLNKVVYKSGDKYTANSSIDLYAVWGKVNENISSTGFRDVSASAWYADAVKFMVENKYMNGTGNKIFEPDSSTTRAMLVTVLYRLEGEPNINTSSMPFNDVKQGWYLKAVAWAYSNGIVNGKSSTKFDPEGTITREEAATMLYRYAKYNNVNTSVSNSLKGFPDTNKVSSWATDALKWANACELINGVAQAGKVYIDPQGYATRAQLATIVMRYCGKY